MMTERENAMIAINHGIPEWVPNTFDAYSRSGSSLLKDQGERGKGGRDLFGSLWLVTADTGYQTIHSPNEHILDDILNWRNVIKFPDIEAMDWAAAARKDLELVDQKSKLFAMVSLTGSFNRLEALMGTCEAMIAMYEEPDAVNELFIAYTDFKVRLIDKYAQYYKPDIYINGDDVATSTGLFFSPEVYRKLVWPHERKLAQAALAKGMIVEHHVCGKIDDIIPDIIATGATIFQTAQRMNDLVGIQQKYHDQLCIHGGWDSIGRCSYPDATETEIREEVRRCIDTYGGYGNYMLYPSIVGDMESPAIQEKRSWVRDECRNYRAKKG